MDISGQKETELWLAASCKSHQRHRHPVSQCSPSPQSTQDLTVRRAYFSICYYLALGSVATQVKLEIECQV